MKLENKLKNHLLQFVQNCVRGLIINLNPNLVLILPRRNLKNLLEFKRECLQNEPRFNVQELVPVSRLSNKSNANKLNKKHLMMKKMIN